MLRIRGSQDQCLQVCAANLKQPFKTIVSQDFTVSSAHLPSDSIEAKMSFPISYLNAIRSGKSRSASWNTVIELLQISRGAYVCAAVFWGLHGGRSVSNPFRFSDVGTKSQLALDSSGPLVSAVGTRIPMRGANRRIEGAPVLRQAGTARTPLAAWLDPSNGSSPKGFRRTLCTRKT